MPASKSARRQPHYVPLNELGNEGPDPGAAPPRRATKTAAAGSAALAERPGASAPGPALTPDDRPASSRSDVPTGVPLPFPHPFRGVRGRCRRIREFPERAGWTVLVKVNAEEEGELGRSIGLKGELLVFWDGVEYPPFEVGRDYYFTLAAG